MGRVSLVLAVMLAMSAAACRDDRSRALHVDTTTRKKSVEVLATPTDSAQQKATAALDSLERTFARARASLDSEALALRDANRLDTAYAARYTAFEHRRAAAAQLRTSRDKARRVRDSLAGRASGKR
jgi:hypothetical protein